MQQSIPLSLNAAAWFFVGESDDAGSVRNVAINPPFKIGRNADLDLTLPSRSVSGLHAQIVEENGGLWLHDLGSTNGTFVNGKRIKTKIRLAEGDTVQFAANLFHISRDQNSGKNRAAHDDGGGDEDAITKIQNKQFDQLFKGGVVPFFQPIVRIDNNQQFITGYEVLGRSKLFGLRTPAQMFAAASRMEMEAELSRVLRNQGIEVAANNLADHYSLFVNTHPAELQCEGLVESLHEIRANFPVRPITVEIHESALNGSVDMAMIQSELHNLDIQLAIYDFGSGQTRLVELSDISPDILKFDVKLVQEIDKATAKRQRFVAAVVKMVKELGITPLAECIESKAAHETLQQLGFELGQGFFYGKPSALPDCLESVSSTMSLECGLKTTSGANPIQSTSPQSDSPAASHNPQSSANAIKAASDSFKNADWLLSRPSNHYTIQVLSAISQKTAEEHIASQDNPEDFAIFRKQGKTRTLYIVVYGVFEDQATAKAASAKLATSAVSPWIRMLNGVHTEIRNTMQHDG